MNQSNGGRVAVVERSQGRTSHESDASFTQAMNEYLEALEAGQPADRAALLRRYPELADELVSCLDGIDFIHQVAPQLGEPTPQEERRDPSERRPPAAALGDYRIIRELGRGGMGVVYEAEQLSMRRRVALKVLPFAAVMDQRQIARFKNEAQAAGLLQHTNIVPVYGVGCERGVHYFAMQYIEGQTLAEVIRELRRGAGLEEKIEDRGSRIENGARQNEDPALTTDDRAGAVVQAGLPQSSILHPRSSTVSTSPLAALSTERSTRPREYFRTVARLGIQAAEALDHAHKNGILHRDVKPGNLMLDMTGNLWVTDFGLARMEGNAQMTISGDLVGTLRYMSPEQALAKRVIVDHRTDIYSLGVTLYELLTLRPAFEGCDRGELLRQIAFEEPRPLCRIDKSVPAEYGTIVSKAMAKNPLERYATAQELADDLRRLLMHEPIKARPPSLFERLAKWSRRHRAWVLAAASVLIVLMVGSLASTAMIWSEKLATENALTREKEQRELARQKADEALWAAEEAEDQRQRAETGFKKAREAVNRMLTRVAEGHIAIIPQMAPVRRELLEDAIAFSSELIELNPKDPFPYFERGRAYNFLNRNVEALADYEKLVELEPNNAEWHNALGTLLIWEDRVSDPKRAAVYLHKAVQLNPDNGLYRMHLAHAYKAAGERDQAVMVIDELLRLQPAFALAHAQRASFDASFDGDANRFLASAERAIELEPTNPYCHVALACAHMVLGQPDQALAAASRAVELGESRVGAYYQSYFYHYQSYIYSVRGDAYMANKRYGEALADYDKSISMDSAAYAHRLRAVAHFRLSHYTEALADLSQAIELKPDDTSTVTSIPPSLVARCPDETFRAGILALADRAIELTNGSADAYSARGILYAQFNQYERARADFGRAISQSDTSSVALYWASLSQLATGDKRGYQDICRGMLDRYRDSEDLGAVTWTAWSCVLAPEAVPDYAEVLRLAQKAVEGKPGDPTAQRALGAALYRAGQIDQAIERLSEINVPNSGKTSPAYAWFFLAMAHHRLGHAEQSRSLLTKAIEQMDAELAADDVSWNRDLTLRLLRQEAESLLQAEDERDATESPRSEASP